MLLNNVHLVKENKRICNYSMEFFDELKKIKAEIQITELRNDHGRRETLEGQERKGGNHCRHGPGGTGWS